MVIIWDGLNGLVWDTSERPVKNAKDINQRYYGKSAKTFRSDKKAEEYARKLAKERKQKTFFDKYLMKRIKV